METPKKSLNKYWCSVPHYLSDIRNIYIKADRFPLMMLTATNKEKKTNLILKKYLSLTCRFVQTSRQEKDGTWSELT
jgi:hypothetical protein